MNIYRRSFANRTRAGLSLVNVLTTIAVIGISGAAAVATYDRVFQKSKEAVSTNTVETINQSVTKYIQLAGTALYDKAPSDSSFVEEFQILRALQWDDPADHDPGTPYLRNDYNPPGSDNASDYRAVWNGSYFEVRVPGEVGAGLKIMFDGSDFGTPYNFPDGFVPLTSY